MDFRYMIPFKPQVFSQTKKKLKVVVESMDIDVEKIISGNEYRTSLMIRNIPNKYNNKTLLAEINQFFNNKYDFFYLPLDASVVV